jgi:hypothetical protein
MKCHVAAEMRTHVSDPAQVAPDVPRALEKAVSVRGEDINRNKAEFFGK